MELHTGKLKKVSDDPDAYAKHLLSRMGYRDGDREDGDWVDTFRELVWEDEWKYADSYLFTKKAAYKVVEHNEHDECGDSWGRKNEDGTIDFMTYFYNGGASFEEALEFIDKL